MIQNYNVFRVMSVFMETPTKGFRLRELSRQLNLGLPSTRKYVMELKHDGFVEKKSIQGIPLYFAARESDIFRMWKVFYNIKMLNECGFTDFAKTELNYPAIILYGSAAQGEDIENSDMDIAIFSESKKAVSEERFEKILKRPLHIMIFNSKELQKLKQANKELLNNILNGVIISGYLKVF